MTENIEPQGPFYVELVYEKNGENTADAIATAFIDGFSTEADAWRACSRSRCEPVGAISREGEHISLEPAQLLQMFVAKTAYADVVMFAAE